MTIKPTHSAIKTFFERRETTTRHEVRNELGTRSAFEYLLETMAKTAGWDLLREQSVKGTNNKTIRPDGVVRGADVPITYGYWEAKDQHDDLNSEIQKKIGNGYPISNMIFEDGLRAVLYQQQQRVGEFDLSKPDEIADLFNRYLSYSTPAIDDFKQAVQIFKDDNPKLADGLKTRIGEAHRSNRAFQSAFEGFYTLCKTGLNPNDPVYLQNERGIGYKLQG